MVRNEEPGADSSEHSPTASDVAALVTLAIDATREAADSPQRADEAWELLVQAAANGPAALMTGTGLLDQTDPVTRSTGCALLGCASELHEEVREDSASALLALAGQEHDEDVLWSIARALAGTQDHRAVPVLLSLAEHSDSEIRCRVAQSLPSVWTEGTDGPEIQMLIKLMRDPDAEVRNWATFGVGTLGRVDNEVVRDSLWERIGDESPEVREEAIHGLARLRDPRATALVVELLSAQNDVHENTFHAAAYLGDPVFLPYLANFDPADPGVAEALFECDPKARARRDGFATALLEALRVRLPNAHVALSCDRFDIGVDLVITQAGEVTEWSIGGLLKRTDGDPELAAELVSRDSVDVT